MLDYCETHDVTDDYGNRLYSVTTVQGAPEPKPVPEFGVPTSTDRIAALEWEVRALKAQVAALSGEVPFPTLRMAEDAWGVG